MRWLIPRAGTRAGTFPHFDLPETDQFITFRLAYSLPRSDSEAMRHREDDVHRIDRELDVGLGACWLGQPEMASLVEDALLQFDDRRYRALACASCRTRCMPSSKCCKDTRRVTSFATGNRSWPIGRTRALGVWGRSGMPTISIGIWARTSICSRRSDSWSKSCEGRAGARSGVPPAHEIGRAGKISRRRARTTPGHGPTVRGGHAVPCRCRRR